MPDVEETRNTDVHPVWDLRQTLTSDDNNLVTLCVINSPNVVDICDCIITNNKDCEATYL
jgi:hypothetical protein